MRFDEQFKFAGKPYSRNSIGYMWTAYRCRTCGMEVWVDSERKDKKFIAAFPPDIVDHSFPTAEEIKNVKASIVICLADECTADEESTSSHAAVELLD